MFELSLEIQFCYGDHSGIFQRVKHLVSIKYFLLPAGEVLLSMINLFGFQGL